MPRWHHVHCSHRRPLRSPDQAVPPRPTLTARPVPARRGHKAHHETRGSQHWGQPWTPRADEKSKAGRSEPSQGRKAVRTVANKARSAAPQCARQRENVKEQRRKQGAKRRRESRGGRARPLRTPLPPVCRRPPSAVADEQRRVFTPVKYHGQRSRGCGGPPRVPGSHVKNETQTQSPGHAPHPPTFTRHRRWGPQREVRDRHSPCAVRPERHRGATRVRSLFPSTTAW